MSYEEEFKKINNEVYNMNKYRVEPFSYYYTSIKEPDGGYQDWINWQYRLKFFFTDENQAKGFSALHDFLMSQRDKKQLEKEIDQLIKELTKKDQISDQDQALLDSLKIDLEDCNKQYRKDMKRQYIE